MMATTTVMMMDNRADDDDTLSSSDGSFMPPVLSDYAKELLAEKGENRVPNARISHLRDDYRLASPYGNKYFQSPSAAPRNESNEATYVASRPGATRFSPIQKSNDSFASDSSNSPAYSTPGVTRNSNKLEHTKSTLRVKRFGKGLGLGPPKRTTSKQDCDNNSNTNNANSSTNNDNINNTPERNTRIRFADENEEIPVYKSPQLLHQEKTPCQKSSALATKSPNKPLNASPKSHHLSTRFSKSSLYSPPPKPQDAVRYQQDEQLSVKYNLGPVHQPAVHSSSSAGKKSRPVIHVNNIPYQRLEVIGKGGSSRVYKVQSTNNKTFALKKVTFDEVDQSVVEGFKGEINLLNRLRDESRVVKLIDYQMFDAGVLLVMEIGEIDLAHVLAARLNQPLDLSFVRYYTVEMLKCVEAVHKHGIVHSDLKPANFLLVKGMLKIIDFGIANVVPDYTANVHRETQIGTPNYMAPEALLEAAPTTPDEHNRATYKVGKPSDVWSCGCILYQMVYGKPPYGHYSGTQRMLAIMNPKVQIQYPSHGLGKIPVPRDVVECIQGCLDRDPRRRWTIPHTLSPGTFLNPQTVNQRFIHELVAHAVQFGIDRNGTPMSSEGLEILASDVWKKIQGLNE
ncbi:serine/threonine-protein kinase Mps1p [Trichomonascus vanleenenianus]|uniref:serine/threonine/tyrosine protein kinase MPS1 n=1 Tax=Trichomonascus vanleenenianus TaxID=2268995 RepID=UPI003ECB72EA